MPCCRSGAVKGWGRRASHFYGPIDSWGDLWFYVSRQGYSGVDASPPASWSDRAAFLGWFAADLVRQTTLRDLGGRGEGVPPGVGRWRREGAPYQSPCRPSSTTRAISSAAVAHSMIQSPTCARRLGSVTPASAAASRSDVSSPNLRAAKRQSSARSS